MGAAGSRGGGGDASRGAGGVRRGALGIHQRREPVAVGRGGVLASDGRGDRRAGADRLELRELAHGARPGAERRGVAQRRADVEAAVAEKHEGETLRRAHGRLLHGPRELPRRRDRERASGDRRRLGRGRVQGPGRSDPDRVPRHRAHREPGAVAPVRLRRGEPDGRRRREHLLLAPGPEPLPG